MIVTLDGPAGAGKSSTARALAERLGFRFLDTGAMYRAVAWAAAEAQHDWSQAESLVSLARRTVIEFNGRQVLVNGRDASDAIRSPEVTEITHYAADNPGVRAQLVMLQRMLAGDDDIVTEGRDQGTVVFPRAECKIFLTASPEERARRRYLEFEARGEASSFEQLLKEQNRRDRRDVLRPVGPLAQAADAVEVSTDGLTREQVVDELEAIVRSRLVGRR